MASAAGSEIVSFPSKARAFEGEALLSKSKLSPPRQPAPLLSLARHRQAIEMVPAHDVTVICGPPASGKTVLAAQAYHGLRATGFGVAWVSCDGQPGSAVTAAVSQALADVIGLPVDRRPAAVVGSAPAPLAIELANRVHDHTSDVLLCLDGADGALDGDRGGFLACLIEYAPTNLHLLLTCRSDRRVLETRIDRRHAISWIPPADLALSDVEAAEALASRGVILNARAASALNRRLAGWWGGLRQVTSPRGDTGLNHRISDGEDFHAAFGATVFAEIVAGLPEQERETLLPCAVPPLVNAELAGLLAADGRAADLLLRLADEGAFVEATGDCFRLHAAFRTHLLERLAERGPQALRDLRRRAGAWFETCDQPTQVIALAAEGDDIDAIADAVARHGIAALDRSGSPVLGAALARIPEERLADDAPLARVALWWTALSGSGTGWPQERAGRIDPEHAALLADLWAEARGTEASGHVASVRVEGGAGFASRLAAVVDGEVALRSGRHGPAQYALAPVIRHARRAGIGIAEARAFIAMADLHRAQGRLLAAEQLLREGRTLVAGASADGSEPAALLGVALAHLRYLQNDVAGAATLLARDVRHLCRLSGGESLRRGMRMAIRMAAAEGRVEQALRLIEQAEDCADAHGCPLLMALASVERTRLCLPPMADPDRLLARADEAAAVADPTSRAARVFAILSEARAYEAIAHLDRPHLTTLAAHMRDLAAARGDIELRIVGTLFDVLPQLSGHCDRVIEIDTVRFLNEAVKLGFVRTITDILDVTGVCTAQNFEGAAGSAGCFLALLRRDPPANSVTDARGTPQALSFLTPREAEIVAVLALGETNKTIARKLGLTPETVKWHMKILMRKLRAGNRGEVVANARTLGLTFGC